MLCGKGREDELTLKKRECLDALWEEGIAVGVSTCFESFSQSRSLQCNQACLQPLSLPFILQKQDNY